MSVRLERGVMVAATVPFASLNIQPGTAGCIRISTDNEWWLVSLVDYPHGIWFRTDELVLLEAQEESKAMFVLAGGTLFPPPYPGEDLGPP